MAEVATFTAQTSPGRYSTHLPNPRMKQKHIATICVLALGLAGSRAQDVKLNIPGKSDQPAAGQAAAAEKPAFTDAQLIEEFGWFIGKRVGLTELEFGKNEVDLLLKGIAQAASGKDSP